MANSNNVLAILRVFGSVVGTNFSDSELNGQIRTIVTKVTSQMPQQQLQKVTLFALLLLLFIFLIPPSTSVVYASCRERKLDPSHPANFKIAKGQEQLCAAGIQPRAGSGAMFSLPVILTACYPNCPTAATSLMKRIAVGRIIKKLFNWISLEAEIMLLSSFNIYDVFYDSGLSETG